MNTSDPKKERITAAVEALERLGLASTADIGREMGVSRQTASKYLEEAKEDGLVENVYMRKDTKLYAKKGLMREGTKPVSKIIKDVEEAFKKYPVID